MHRIRRYFLDQQPLSSSHSQIPHFRYDRCHANHLHLQIRKFTLDDDDDDDAINTEKVDTVRKFQVVTGFLWCYFSLFFRFFHCHSITLEPMHKYIQKKNQRSHLRWPFGASISRFAQNRSEKILITEWRDTKEKVKNNNSIERISNINIRNKTKAMHRQHPTV